MISNRMKTSSITLAAVLFASSAAHAAALPSVAAPAGMTVRNVAGTMNSASAVHHNVAEPVVSNAVPASAPLAAGVTRGTADMSSGLSGTGGSIGRNGLTASPSGLQRGVNAAKGNGVASVRAGNTELGGGSRPPVAVNVASSSPRSGTLATAGAGDSNALLSATVAPQ